MAKGEKEKKKKSRSRSKERSSSKPRSSSKSKERSSSKSRSTKKPHSSAENGAPDETLKDTDSEFQAGLLFHRYAQENGGQLGPEEFQKLWTEQLSAKAAQLRQKNERPPLVPPRITNSSSNFDVGRLFGHMDNNKDFKISPSEFEQYMKGDPNPQTQYSPKAAVHWEEPAPTTIPAPMPVPKRYTHYNETTGVPLLQEHAATQAMMGHTVIPLQEAYHRRALKLRQALAAEISPRQEALLGFQKKIQACIEEVKAESQKVERETMSDAEAILERLHNAESLKTSRLTQLLNQTTADLETIQRLTIQTEGEGTNESEQMLNVIQSYPDILSNIEKVTMKPLNLSVDIQVNDFQHETAERLEVLRRSDKYEKALAMKDQMLWELMQENLELKDKLENEQVTSEEYGKEMAEWVDLTNRMSEEINSLKINNARLNNYISNNPNQPQYNYPSGNHHYNFSETARPANSYL